MSEAGIACCVLCAYQFGFFDAFGFLMISSRLLLLLLLLKAIYIAQDR